VLLKAIVLLPFSGRNKRTDGRNFPREKKELLENIRIRPAQVIMKSKCLKTQFLKVDITHT